MTRPLRFIHCADLHLDAPFQGVSADDSSVGVQLAQATFSAFDRIIDECLAYQSDFLLISGDAFDRPVKSYYAQRCFQRGMQRLAEAGIKVYLAWGNHDPANSGGLSLAMPDNVHIFSHVKVERLVFERDGEALASIYGRSFGRRDEKNRLVLEFTRQPEDAFAIGVLHTNVGMNADYDPYAPASVDELRAARMDYWALGHIHKQQVLSEEPFIGYPGSPQGINPKETGAHGCYRVEVASGHAHVEHVDTASIKWLQSTVEAAGAENIDDVREVLARACAEARCTGRSTIARFTLVGRTPAHAELTRPGVLDGMLSDLRQEQVSIAPWVWVDRVEDATAGVIDLDAVRAGMFFDAEFMKVSDALAVDAAQLRALIEELSAPVSTTLLGEYKPDLTDAELLERARDIALDSLLSGGDL